MDSYHLGQLRFHTAVESGTIFCFHRISTGIPVPVRPETADAPKGIFRPEEHALAVASLDKSRGMRIMGAANKVESGFFHHTHVAPHAGFGHGIAPSGMILMHVSPSQIKVLAIQEEAFVCRPLHPSESQNRLCTVEHPAFPRQRADHLI